jgi:hypothetical protein
VSVGTRQAPYGRRRGRQPHVVGALLGTLALLVVAGFLLGRTVAPPPATPDVVNSVRGIPVGVDHSPPGALAAADNYVAVSYGSVERDPATNSRLIDTVYATGIRASALSGAAAVRAQNPDAMSLWRNGGQNLSLIGARRLDYYRGDAAQVTTWNADIFWGPGRQPKQAWVLTQTSLRWSRGTWLVTGTSTLPTAGPVPALTPQASSSNDSVAAFRSSLGGFAAPGYGAAG